MGGSKNGLANGSTTLDTEMGRLATVVTGGNGDPVLGLVLWCIDQRRQLAAELTEHELLEHKSAIGVRTAGIQLPASPRLTNADRSAIEAICMAWADKHCTEADKAIREQLAAEFDAKVGPEVERKLLKPLEAKVADAEDRRGKLATEIATLETQRRQLGDATTALTAEVAKLQGEQADLVPTHFHFPTDLRKSNP